MCTYRLNWAKKFVAMSRLRLSLPHDTHQKDMFRQELNTCSHVFLRCIAIAPPLTASYDGPYKVVARSGRVLKVMIKGKVETVTADHVKPAHIKHKPENECTIQCRATPSSKPMASKPQAKFREPQTAVVGARSPTTSKPFRTEVYTKKKSNARSTIQTKETVPAVKQRCDMTEEQSNKRPTLYRAPHTRMVITSRANGKDKGLRTYSRIPLHLRNNVPV